MGWKRMRMHGRETYIEGHAQFCHMSLWIHIITEHADDTNTGKLTSLPTNRVT